MTADETKNNMRISKPFDTEADAISFAETKGGTITRKESRWHQITEAFAPAVKAEFGSHPAFGSYFTDDAEDGRFGPEIADRVNALRAEHSVERVDITFLAEWEEESEAERDEKGVAKKLASLLTENAKSIRPRNMTRDQWEKKARELYFFAKQSAAMAGPTGDKYEKWGV